MDKSELKETNRPSRTTLWLVAGFGMLLILVLLFAAQRGGDQDRLGDGATLSLPDAQENSAECTSATVIATLKRGLFDAAAEGRPGDADAFRQIASIAVARMENAALESEEGDRLSCSGSLAIDLPPGIVTSGGRRHLMGDIDYSVTRGGGPVQIRNASNLVNALAGLARSANGISGPIAPSQPEVLKGGEPVQGTDVAPDVPAAGRAAARPSFDCARARTRGEQAICADPGLASLDRQMASQYQRAMAGAAPDRQALLRQTRDRFLAFRDRCPDDACLAEAYQGRMREISDILAGRWQPPR